jgi:hypothetical protein
MKRSFLVVFVSFAAGAFSRRPGKFQGKKTKNKNTTKSLILAQDER